MILYKKQKKELAAIQIYKKFISIYEKDEKMTQLVRTINFKPNQLKVFAINESALRKKIRIKSSQIDNWILD